MLIADQPSPHTTSATGHRRYWGFRGDRRGLSRRSIRGSRASDALKVFPMDVSADPDWTWFGPGVRTCAWRMSYRLAVVP